jgi:hypothetical protein
MQFPGQLGLSVLNYWFSSPQKKAENGLFKNPGL